VAEIAECPDHPGGVMGDPLRLLRDRGMSACVNAEINAGISVGTAGAGHLFATSR